MANDKVWTATDLKTGRITMEQNGADIDFALRYQFVDAGGVVLTDLPRKSLTLKKAISTIPQSVLESLILVQTFLYEKALEAEGME